MPPRGRGRVVMDFRDIDRGWQRMRKLAREAEQSSIKVGVLAGSEKEARKDEAITNTQLAAIHEYGAPSRGIPERSFLRATLDQNRAAYNTLISQLVALIFDGKLTVARALGVLGQKVVADIRARIRKGIAPPLSPRTLRLKLLKGGRGKRNRGKSVPLIDTGQLINSITYAVELVRGHVRGGGAKP